jgi:hypothetical protein
MASLSPSFVQQIMSYVSFSYATMTDLTLERSGIDRRRGKSCLQLTTVKLDHFKMVEDIGLKIIA